MNKIAFLILAATLIVTEVAIAGPRRSCETDLHTPMSVDADDSSDTTNQYSSGQQYHRRASGPSSYSYDERDVRSDSGPDSYGDIGYH